MKIIALFACLLLAPALAGCLDYTQEIVVNPDGSGSSTVDFGMSSSLLAMGNRDGADGAAETREKFARMRDRLKAHPAVRDAGYREYSEGDLQHFVVTVALDDITRLEELQDELSAEQAGDQADGNKSDMSIRRQADGTLAFRYLLAAEPPPTPEGQDAQMTTATRSMMQSAFAGRNFTIRLRGPQIRATATGAAGSLPTTETGQVEWKIPFSELFSGEPFSREMIAIIDLQPAGRPRPAMSGMAPMSFTAVYTGSIVPTLPALYVPNYQSHLRPAWRANAAAWWQYPAVYR